MEFYFILFDQLGNMYLICVIINQMAHSKFVQPEIHKASTKDLFYSLVSEYQWLDLLKDVKKPYNALIDMLQQEGQKEDDDCSPTPTIKKIAEQLAESSANISKWLRQMYNELWELNEVSPIVFQTSGHKYLLHFQDTSTKQTAAFTLWLDISLAKSERFDWVFLRGTFRSSWFYISEINHEYKKGQLQTIVFLKSGFPNSYRDTLLDKATFMNLMDFIEIHNLPGYQLDDVLREYIERDRRYDTLKTKTRSYKRRFD